MVAYADLTDQEKTDIQNLLAIVRPGQASILNLGRKFQPAMSLWNGGVSALVATLDANEPIPNTTTLAGAEDVTKENLANNLMSYTTDVAALTTQAHVDNMTPAAGSINLAAEG